MGKGPALVELTYKSTDKIILPPDYDNKGYGRSICDLSGGAGSTSDRITEENLSKEGMSEVRFHG